MIDLSKTYIENIEHEENKTLKRFVDDVITTGSVNEKYTILLDEDKIKTIILLALLKIKKNPEVIERTWNVSDKPPRSKNPHLYRKDPKEYELFRSNIGKFFSQLSFNSRMDLMRFIGIDFIAYNSVDDIEEFKNTMVEALKKRQ